MSVTTQTFEAVITVQTPVEGFTQPSFKIAISSNGHGKLDFESAKRAAFACPGCSLPTNLPSHVLIAIHQRNGKRFMFPCPRADCGFPIVISVEW